MNEKQHKVATIQWHSWWREKWKDNGRRFSSDVNDTTGMRKVQNMMCVADDPNKNVFFHILLHVCLHFALVSAAWSFRSHKTPAIIILEAAVL